MCPGGRIVAQDNTVRYQGRSLQIPPDPHRFHYVKATVRVHEYPDGTLTVFHGSRCLARYDAEGQVRERAQLSSVITTRPQGAETQTIVALRSTVRE